MNRRLIILLVAPVLLLVAAAPLIPGERAPTSAPFEGTWEAIDTLDGSRLRIWIRAEKDIDPLYNIRYFDQSCGGCADMPGTGRFVGLLVEENQIHGIGYFRSQGHVYFYQMEGEWFYNPQDDTVIEHLGGFEQIYHRAAAN